MPPYTRRRPRDPDPVVAARLQAISYADPYVFVHANDVMDSDPSWEDGLVGGWVPEPQPSRAPDPAPRSDPARWVDAVRQRLEPARSGVAAFVVLGLVCVAVAGFVFFRAQPTTANDVLPVRSPVQSAVVGRPTAGGPTPAATMLVDVTGKVRHPGVIRLKTGARVIDALRAAGGALPGTSVDSLNLAAKVADGQQVAVGTSAASAMLSGGGAASAAAAASVDLNTATAAQLQTLPGIGPVLAQRIIDYRTAHGPFAGVDGLQQVGGIGPSKFAQLKDHATA